MCKIIDKTCLSPTPTLEQHLMWDDIAILARYMLMLSFNNSLDVAAHLPYLFHVVTLLVATGPLSLRASTHGLVINIIHSLCTCSQLCFSGKSVCVLESFHDRKSYSIDVFHLLCRGDQGGSAFKPDRILAAQVLPVVWDKQGEIGRSHRLSFQLSRSLVLSRLV